MTSESGRTAKGGKKKVDVEEKEKQSMGAWVREQIEAIVVAVVLALLIRHFVVEAFKIPTGSMQPTLYGSEVRGDRILVFKPAYMIAPPSRFDIVVFKYPLDTTVNYIKRLIGLPGEEIALVGGDIEVDGEVARKPDVIQEAMWRNWPVYPREGVETPVERYWRQSPEGSFTRRGDDVVVEAAEGESTLRYPSAITVWSTARGADPGVSQAQRASSIVSDVLLRYEARIDSEDTILMAEIRESNHVFRLEIPAGEAPRIRHFEVRPNEEGELVRTGGDPIGVAEGAELAVGKRRRIDFTYVDASVRLAIDGDDKLDIPFRIDDERRARNHVLFGVERGSASFRDVRLFRDLYHTPIETTRLTVPEGHYFFLGDNTLQSKDGRMWNVSELELEDGSTLRFDADQGAGRGITGRILEFIDENGQRRLMADYPTASLTSRPFPVVPEKYILGKAFSTFWPIFRDGGLNLKFVH